LARGRAAARRAARGRGRLRRRRADARGRGRRQVRGGLRRADRRHPREARRAGPNLTESRDLVERIWSRDPTVWTGADEARWLGWPDGPSRMSEGGDPLLTPPADLAR